MSEEYWIQEDGSVEFADGDVGDMNHEAIVIRLVSGNIMTRCEDIFDVRDERGRHFSDDEYPDWDKFLYALAEAYAEEYIKKFPEKERKVNRILENDPEKLYMPALKQANIKQAEFDCASGRGDARDYAMMYWKWKTYRNGNIDTWTFNKGDLQAIISGIESIASEENWSDKALDRIKFNITVFSTKKHFYLTYKQMLNPRQPSSQQNPMYDYLTAQADKQIKDIELQKMHPAYRRPGINPFGDATIHSFKLWSETENLKESLYHKEYNPHPHGQNFDGGINIMLDYIEERNATEPYNIGVVLEKMSKLVRDYSKVWEKNISIKVRNPSSEEDVPYEPEEHIQAIQARAHNLSYLANQIKFAADKAYQYNQDPEEAKAEVDREIRYIKTAMRMLRKDKFLPHKLVSQTEQMLTSLQETLDRIIQFIMTRWGRSDQILAKKDQPQDGDPVRVFDSQYMTGGIPYLDGTIVVASYTGFFSAKYADGRTERLTGVTYGDRNRLTWNRGSQRWEFK